MQARRSQVMHAPFTGSGGAAFRMVNVRVDNAAFFARDAMVAFLPSSSCSV
jgi:hypothetical protein